MSRSRKLALVAVTLAACGALGAAGYRAFFETFVGKTRLYEEAHRDGTSLEMEVLDPIERPGVFVPHGRFIFRWSNGNPAYTGQFRYGQPTGIFRELSPKGTLWREIEVRDGKIHTRLGKESHSRFHEFKEEPLAIESPWIQQFFYRQDQERNYLQLPYLRRT